jgi:hypothetical protein
MHLFYLDESGHPTDSKQDYFVLGGFSVFERQSFWFEAELEKIAARFNPAEPRSVELHGSPMLQGRGIWRSVPLEDRLQAIKDAISVLTKSHPGNRIFGVVVKKSLISPQDPVEYCFEQISSRFDQYLWRLHMRSNTQRGIIILDKSTYENTLQGLATNFRSIGHSWGVLRNLAEVPLFLDSKASRLIQLADLIAFGIFRKYEKNDDRFFNLFANRFDSDGDVKHGFFQKI